MSMQQSDEHGPAVDDALTDERRQSSAGTRHEMRPEDDPLGAEAEDLRREVARFLGPAAFPGDAARIQAVAADNDATDEVRRSLARLPEDGTYESVEDVLRAIDAP
jgi:hypothetical protein